MNVPETKQHRMRVAQYLQCMQALRFEMTTSMECIATSALLPLQESIARQEVLCAELLAFARSPGFIGLTDADVAVAARVRETSASLHQTNIEYAAVLKHSGRSLALLSSLCSIHTGQFQEARGSGSKYQTWSCEM